MNPSLSISVTVKGDKECAAALNKSKQNLPRTKQKQLEEVSNLFVRTAKTNAHVITGNMKKSIIAHVDAQSGKAIIEAGVNYAVYENARGGNHAFWDKAKTQIQKDGKLMVKKQEDQNFKSAGVPLK